EPAEEGNALDSPVGDRGSRLLLAGGSGTRQVWNHERSGRQPPPLLLHPFDDIFAGADDDVRELERCSLEGADTEQIRKDTHHPRDILDPEPGAVTDDHEERVLKPQSQ